MSRPVWKGHISFGLVSVPVELYPAERRTDVSFHMVDSRNSARVRYQRVNEETGEEVPWDKIVKGYEYDENNYVLLSDDELEHASAKMTRAIEIEQFVELSQIDIRYFDRPYLITPTEKGAKGYVLLREAAAKQQMAGIATIVIRARQHLAALIVQGEALILELLRFHQELRDLGDYDIPSSDLRKYKVTQKEVDLAAQLVQGMSSPWKPAAYKDEYRGELMKLIEQKIKRGKTAVIESGDDEGPAEEPRTINFMDVLRESVAKTAKTQRHTKGPLKSRSTSRHPAARTRRVKKKRAS
jgi:DNA end-binding protein Ku